MPLTPPTASQQLLQPDSPAPCEQGRGAVRPADRHEDRKFVGIAIDATMAFGREIMRGILRYANMHRRWTLHEAFHVTAQLHAWPTCDGTLMTAMAPAVVEQVRAASAHVVHCSEFADPAEFPKVSVDGNGLGIMAAEHLLSCGLRHFAYFGDLDTRSRRGYALRQMLADRGYTCSMHDPFENRGTPWQAMRLEETHAWLQGLPKPAGIFAFDDNHGRILARVCETANVSIPDQVAIIGVNNDDLLCESTWPPLSSVAVDFSQIGFKAAQLLDRLMDGERLEEHERQTLVAPSAVVRRQSTDLLAIDDPELAQAINFIREHACRTCGVDDVLRHVPISRRSLERRMASKLGKSPHDFINEVKVERARDLLIHSDESLEQVATLCGFVTAQTFSRVFQRSVGKFPSAYRREHRSRTPL